MQSNEIHYFETNSGNNKKNDPILREIDQVLYTENNTIRPEQVYTSKTPTKQFSPSTILRTAGILLLTAGIVTFLIQGINSISFFLRHWLFMGITASFGIIGAILGLRFNEMKGARTFFILTLVALPTLFSQLGGMILALVNPPSRVLPYLLSAPALEVTPIVIATVITVLIMMPITIFGFRVLGRSKAYILSSTYFLSCMTLLVPVRNGVTGGIVLLFLISALSLIDRMILHHDKRLSTLEGTISRVLLLLPVSIMIMRGLFYEAGSFYEAMLLTGIGIGLFFTLSRNISENVRLAAIFQTIGTFLFGIAVMKLIAFRAGWIFLFEMPGIYAGGFSISILLMVLAPFTLPAAGVKLYRMFAAIVYIITVAAVHMMAISPAASLPSIAGAVAVLITGTFYKDQRLVIIGTIGGVISIGNCMVNALQYNGNIAWVFLAIAGTAVLVTASLIDSGRLQMGTIQERWNKHFKK